MSRTTTGRPEKPRVGLHAGTPGWLLLAVSPWLVAGSLVTARIVEKDKDYISGLVLTAALAVKAVGCLGVCLACRPTALRILMGVSAGWLALMAAWLPTELQTDAEFEARWEHVTSTVAYVGLLISRGIPHRLCHLGHEILMCAIAVGMAILQAMRHLRFARAWALVPIGMVAALLGLFVATATRAPFWPLLVPYGATVLTWTVLGTVAALVPAYGLRAAPAVQEPPLDEAEG